MDQFVVSARKYRPDTFESVVGQEAITTTLKNAIRSGHIAQSFLFCGPRGVGKTTCARILAKTINCMNPTPDMEACGECESCRGFQENASQNIYELDAASNRSVEAMRSLIEQVRIPPQVGRYKVYIIDEVHMLTTEAFNAFLKTLEEPPAYAKFILATTERHKILPPILSRCQISDFKRITTEDIVKHLQKIAVAENITAEEEALRIIAQKADGGLRDALSMFDQLVSFSNGQVTYNQVISLLNILDYDYYFRFTDLFLKGDHTQLLLLFNQVLDHGFDAQHFVNGLNQHFRNLLLSQDGQTRPLLEMSPALQERYGQQSAQCPPQTLLDGMTLCTRCDLDYRASNNKRLLTEMLLLQICALFGQSVFPSVVSNPTEVEGKPSKETTAEAPSAPKPQPEPQTATVPSPTLPSRPETRDAVPHTAVQAHSPTPLQPAQTGTRRAPLSIKHIQKNLAAIQQTAAQTVTVADTARPLDFSGLQSIWDAYADGFQSKSPGKYDILKHARIKGEGHTVELTVGNAVQADMLEEDKAEICAALRQALQADALSLSIRIDEQVKQDVKVYTAQEKYKSMLEQNAELRNFKEMLQLDIE
nr:DNA polymerase III subunit gamma/tau [Bacteroidales bacterium]